jgi:ribonuclease P protein component
VAGSASSKARKSFPKSRRLLRHADFDRVYKQGRRHFAADVTVIYLRRPKEQESAGLRIGFAVGKTLGGAVQRNRIKRRLGEAARLAGFPDNLAVDVVMNPKRSVLSVEFSVLQAEVAKAFETMMRSIARDALR